MAENTDSGLTVAFDFLGQNDGDGVSDATMAEIVRRLIGMVVLATSDGGTVVSKVAPVDTSLVWYLADDNGIPTGQSFTYNEATSLWESTDQELPAFLSCISDQATNLITLDGNGCILVDQETVELLIASKQVTISPEAGNELRVDEDGKILITISADANNCLSKGSDGGFFVSPPIYLATPELLVTGSDAGGNFDLSGVAGLAIPAGYNFAVTNDLVQPYREITGGSFISYAALGAGITLDLFGLACGKSV